MEFHSGVSISECGVRNVDCQVGKGYNTEKSEEYKGYQSHTILFKECQRWSSDFPHVFNELEEDWCRNPNIAGKPQPEEGVWCYTYDRDDRWDYCPVRRCSDCDTGGYLLPTAV